MPVMHTRLHMWTSALKSWRLHPIVGIGFVPEVPTEVSLGVKNTWGLESGYAPPISGPHNSFLSIVARTGIVGSLLFIWMIYTFFRQAWTICHVSQPIGIFELLLFILPINGVIYASFNVGFESPPRAMLMWFFLGILSARYAQIREE